MNKKLIKIIAVVQALFGAGVILHNVLLINYLGSAQPLQLAGLLDGILIILFAVVYMVAVRD